MKVPNSITLAAGLFYILRGIFSIFAKGKKKTLEAFYPPPLLLSLSPVRSLDLIACLSAVGAKGCCVVFTSFPFLSQKEELYRLKSIKYKSRSKVDFIKATDQ